jgi:hypothetical protein
MTMVCIMFQTALEYRPRLAQLCGSIVTLSRKRNLGQVGQSRIASAQ